MFAGLSLFYPDVVIGRPGARCDALEAQNMIVCIPGARRCYQRSGLVNLGYKILVRNLRDCAKMGLTLPASYSVPHTQLFTLSTSSVGPPISHFAPSTSHLTPRAWAHTTSHIALCTSSVGPSQQTIALANMPFRPVPKARGPSRRGLWGPVNDNHYHYRLQTGMIIIII